MIRFAALLLVVCVVGLPINHLLGYLLVLCAAVLIWFGDVAAARSRWLAAVAVAALVVITQWTFPAPRIEEGHNVFVADPGRGPGALEAGLPREVYQYMLGEFDRAYPVERRCGLSQDGCWRHETMPETAYGFSPDAIYQQPAFSRRVTHIDFSSASSWRAGFANEPGFRWFPKVSDVERGTITFSRNLLFGGRVGWEPAFPWFTMFSFPKDFVGSALCWRGAVLWEDSRDRFTLLDHSAMTCRPIAEQDIGKRIYGISIRQPADLAMVLQPTWPVRLHGAWSAALTCIGAIAVLLLLVKVRWRSLVVPAAALAATFAVIQVMDPTLAGGPHFYEGGDDGLLHDGLGRVIVRALLNGELMIALRGGEDIYFFTAGLRYVRAFEKFIFGDANFGTFSLLLIAPLLVFELYRRLTSLPWALTATIMFVISWGGAFGLSLYAYTVIATVGYPDTAGTFIFIAGLLAVMSNSAREDQSWGLALGGALLLALSVFLRPNLLPMAGIIAGGATLIALHGRRFPRAAALCLGFSTVGVMALHNWAFGGKFVPLGSNTSIPQVLAVSPRIYIAALWDLVQFDFSADSLAQVRRQLGRWIRSSTGQPVTAILSVPMILILIRVFVTGMRYPVWVWLIAAAALSGQAVALFYMSIQRYHLLTWFLTSLIATVWLRKEALPALRRKYPAQASRWDNSAMRLSLARGWERFERTLLVRQ